MSPEATKDVLASVIREQLSESDAGPEKPAINQSEHVTEGMEQERAVVSDRPRRVLRQSTSRKSKLRAFLA